MQTAPVYSNIGVTRTIPKADDDLARARIAFFGCSQLVSIDSCWRMFNAPSLGRVQC